MLNEGLQKKVDRAIKLLQAYNDPNNPVEVAYSGGKDSDVILQLTKESGINYRAIYKNTTIDPPGTIAHAIENGAEVIRPTESFAHIIQRAGYPNRFKRFCCAKLKEYKILNKSIQGIRRCESNKRAKNYQEPTKCRWYGAKTEQNHVEVILPILDWTDEDEMEFIKDRNIKLHALYYREDGTLDLKKQLGCMCCPLAYYKERIRQFEQHPGMVKFYIRNGEIFRKNHPDAAQTKAYKDAYEWFVREIFFEKHKQWLEYKASMFGEVDHKKYIEDYFGIKL